MPKCCGCYNLRYGYLTYGILSMAVRLMACISLYFISIILTGPLAHSSEGLGRLVIPSISFYDGWIINSAVCLYFALKGIVQERSILIYPYLVILIVECFVFLIIGILATIFATPYYLIILPLVIATRIYDFQCLRSLYKHMKNDEIVQFVRWEMEFLSKQCDYESSMCT